MEWEDIWSCACDSECPECGADIQPYDWEELEDLRERRRTPSIQASQFELQFIFKIAERATAMAQRHGIEYTHATALTDVLEPQGVGVIIEAYHLCMMMRGVEKQNSRTITSALRGVFRDDARTREEFLSLAHAKLGV